jgi:hypothetical protein
MNRTALNDTRNKVENLTNVEPSMQWILQKPIDN